MAMYNKQRQMSPQQAMDLQKNQLRGAQDFYRLKMGYKPMPYQVEQPSSSTVDTTPSYLQDMKPRSK